MSEEKIAKFLEYLQTENEIDPWTQDLIRNLIDYAYKMYGHSKGAARDMIADIIPYLDLEAAETLLPDFREE